MTKIKEIILALAIMTVLNLFINYGVMTFYKSPKYENFCTSKLSAQQYLDKVSCESVGGQWFENNSISSDGMSPRPVKIISSDDQQINGWCNSTVKCSQDYEQAKSFYNRNVFMVLITVGLIALILGLAVISINALANGFLAGGLILMIIGTIRYWSETDDYLRFAILGVTLIILIWLGYKKLKTKK